MSEYFEDKDFDINDLNKISLLGNEFDNCTFNNIDLSSIDFSDSKFTECKFLECNLSNSKLYRTSFRDITFMGCKMMGLLFDTINPLLFKVEFDNCNLANSSFFEIDLTKCKLIGCDLSNVDFSSSDLTQIKFKDCNLFDATFENTILDKTDFFNTQNVIINLDKNKVKGAVFNQNNLRGLLQQYDIIMK